LGHSNKVEFGLHIVVEGLVDVVDVSICILLEVVVFLIRVILGVLVIVIVVLSCINLVGSFSFASCVFAEQARAGFDQGVLLLGTAVHTRLAQHFQGRVRRIVFVFVVCRVQRLPVLMVVFLRIPAELTLTCRVLIMMIVQIVMICVDWVALGVVNH